MIKDDKKAFTNDMVLKSDWTDAKTWENLGHVGVIRDWAGEVLDAFEVIADVDQWQLVGRAVTIIHEDVDYCREVYKRVAKDTRSQFVVIPADKVFSIFNQYDHECDDAPQLIYLEPGPWMQEFDPETSTVDKTTLDNVQQKIIDLIVAVSNLPPVIIGTSTDDYNKFASKFRQAHLFNRRFAIPNPSYDESAKVFLDNIGLSICDESLTNELTKVGKLLDIDFNDKRRQGIVALSLKRVAKRESRLLNFKDLVYIAVHGSIESDPIVNNNEDLIRRVAVHEAGHAVIAIVDSNASNYPDYLSAIPTYAYKGMMVDSYSYSLKNDEIKSYRNLRHKVRVFLAGRAAEQLVLGFEEVSCYGAKDDLENATRICNDMFGICGIPLDIEESELADNNLMVLTSDPSLSDHYRIDRLVRKYLKKQYKIVYGQLRIHRIFLDNIVTELIQTPFLFEEDLSSLWTRVSQEHYVREQRV